MKRFLIVLCAITLIIGVLITGLLTLRDFRDSGDLARLEKEVEVAGKQTGGAAKDLYKGMLKNAGIDVSSSRFTIAGLVTALATLLVLAALVLLFMAQPEKSKIVGLAVIVFAIIMIFVNPSYNTGITGGVDSRTLALTAGVFAIIGALLSLAVARMRQKQV
jgi:drug/metabolite transporter (DMT)-like permease